METCLIKKNLMSSAFSGALSTMLYLHLHLYDSADSRRAVVCYWLKYVHEVLVNRLSLPRKSVVRLTNHPDMILDVYRGCKTTTTTSL